jgi:LysM domain-containing protein
MAIAPLPDLDLEPAFDLDEVPWPRPALRLVEPVAEACPTWAHPAGSALVADRVAADHSDTGRLDMARSDMEIVWDVGRRPVTEAEGPLRPVDLDGPAHRQGRASARVRRRRLALGALVAGVLVALALPVSALGSRPAPATPAVAAPGGAAATASVATAAGTVYTVQPGDTLWSIASRADGGNPRPLAEALAARLGSTTVVPGERIVIP